jgi:hypothetical protein
MRRGLARTLVTRAAHGLPTHGAGTVDIAINVDGATITQSMRLRGPGEVAGLAASQIVREEPAGGTQNFEPNYFVALELAAPDLPWMFTPARASRDDTLVPWLALVVVEDHAGVSVSSRSSAPLPVLTIASPADAQRELPDLSEAWAWAHVQTTLSFDTQTVGEAYAAKPEAFVARLVAPRQLAERTAYIACVVPVFEAGRRAGLGLDVDLDDVTLAWTSGVEAIELPVYHSWTFRTGPDGDFESLVRRLTPRELDAGARNLDIGDPGSKQLPLRPGTLVSFRGALVSPTATVREWPGAHRTRFQSAMRTLLDAALNADASADPRDYDPLVDDPVVAPPAYGTYAAGEDHMPQPLRKGETANARNRPVWLGDVNLDPVNRAASGLGAEVVRRNQEALMASAWAQATSLRDVNRVLNWTRLAGESGSRLKATRIDGLTDGDLMQFTAPAHSRIAGAASAQTVTGQLRDSGVPVGLVTATFRRITRRGGTADRGLATRGTSAAVGASITQRFITDLEGSLAFAAYVRPLGAQVTDESLISAIPGASVSHVVTRSGRRIFARRSARRLAGGLSPVFARVARSYAVGTPVSVLLQDSSLPARALIVLQPAGVESSNLPQLAGLVRAALDPVPVLSAKLRARVTAPDVAWGAHALPASMTADPTFPEPLYESLRRLDPEFLLPGVGVVPDDTVGLLQVNAAFVEAFLLGANHELGREFIWREYPVDLSQTWLRTFWDAIDDDVRDIKPVDGWTAGRLGTHQTGAAAGGTLVIVVKGTLLRRYPDTVIYATRARWSPDGTTREEDDGATGEHRDPLFVGTLDRTTAFLGFRLTLDEARGSDGQPGWFFAFEQPPTLPRFGLDVAKPVQAGKTPRFWKNVSWAHQVDDIDALPAMTYARARGRLAGTTLPYDRGGFDETWGKDATAMARITLQRPVRMLVHASAILPPAEGV